MSSASESVTGRGPWENAVKRTWIAQQRYILGGASRSRRGNDESAGSIEDSGQHKELGKKATNKDTKENPMPAEA